MSLFLKSRNERLLGGYNKIVAQITALRAEFSVLDDEHLRERTHQLKVKLRDGAPFKSIVPSAVALACVASERSLGLAPYDVQVVGALALLDGKIAEMRTGEGKTLTAALAAFARSLEEKGVHVVTVNDYLARRDSTTMSVLFGLLGQSVGVVYPGMPEDSKVSAYAADITYATNSEIGFDYLRDNMAVERTEQNMRGLHYAIVDEVDSILIDEARTPLIISGPHTDGPDMYQAMDAIARQMTKTTDEKGEEDYWVDEKNRQVLLTENGMERAESLLREAGFLQGDDSLYAVHNISYVYHLNAALRAHSLYHKDVEYLVKDGQVQIVDEFSGRVLPGRRWGDGLHQAIEVKEGVEIKPEQQTVASVTLQNLFRAYTHLSGMTGTADTEAGEFMEIYGLEVVVIPTHRPMVRKDASDMVFLNMNGKLRRVVQDIKEYHARRQPVLVGTASIEMSQRVSKMLQEEGIVHNVLNAKQHEKEAAIVAEAGTLGAVTIATNMAGRGTDIVLGGSLEHLAPLKEALHALKEEHGDHHPLVEAAQQQLDQSKQAWLEHHQQVVELGGLHIIGTERHESRRIDNQLRGRAGRQGDPGSSQFYISFEDPLMALFASDFAKRTLAGLGMKEDDVINMQLISRQIERAQRNVEAHNFNIRKSLLDYDNISNEQRKAYYGWREEILGVSDITEHALDAIEDTLSSNIQEIFAKHDFESEQVWGDIESLLVGLNVPPSIFASLNRNTLTLPGPLAAHVVEEIASFLRQRHADVGGEWLLQTRAILLTAHDLHWREHLAALDTLRKGIHLRGFAQKQPKQEYKREAFEMFKTMVQAARYDATRGVLAMTARIGLPAPVPARSFVFDAPRAWVPTAEKAKWNTEEAVQLASSAVTPYLPAYFVRDHASMGAKVLPGSSSDVQKNSKKESKGGPIKKPVRQRGV